MEMRVPCLLSFLRQMTEKYVNINVQLNHKVTDIVLNDTLFLSTNIFPSIGCLKVVATKFFCKMKNFDFEIGSRHKYFGIGRLKTT